MPVDEIEMHPFLWNQVDYTNLSKLSKYCKLIVGTFPIYAITDSLPLENEGVQRKINWQNEANFQYFYGSKKNHIWRLLSHAFQENTPNDTDEAISLLNRNNLFMTDVVRSSFRVGYGSSDNDLVISTLNDELLDILNNSLNLKIIYFTSIQAKRWFCQIIDITFDNSRDVIEVINDRRYRMVILPSPAGNGRTVTHFFNTFPLDETEQLLIANNNPYALAYRERYFDYYLTIPCD